MMTKPLVLLFGAAVSMMMAGCQAHSPHKKMRIPPPPVVSSENYRVYDAAGKPSSLDAVVRAAMSVDVVFIGEEHDDPVGHFLEAEILKRLDAAYGTNDVDEHGRRIVLSMEMFERDIQTVMDEYLDDLITERHFLKAARPWPNYRTDYRPLVEYAKSRGIPVVAANVPGRYVNRAARLGRSSLTALPTASKAWLPPLPYGAPSPRYREKFAAFWEEANEEGAAPHGPAPAPSPDAASMKTAAAPKKPPEASEAFEHMMDAQSLWDAGMAWSLAEALRRYTGALAVHVNGKFHSEYGLGIPEHLMKYRPDLSFLTITMMSLPSFPAFDPAAAGSGNFIIVTDPSLKKTVDSDRPRR